MAAARQSRIPGVGSGQNQQSRFQQNFQPASHANSTQQFEAGAFDNPDINDDININQNISSARNQNTGNRIGKVNPAHQRTVPRTQLQEIMDIPNKNQSLQQFDDQFDDLDMEDKDLLLDDEMDDAELGNLGEGLMTNPNGEPGDLDNDWNNMNNQPDKNNGKGLDQIEFDREDVDDLDENVQFE